AIAGSPAPADPAREAPRTFRRRSRRHDGPVGFCGEDRHPPGPEGAGRDGRTTRMKTDALIDAIVASGGAAQTRSVRRRYAVMLAVGTVVTALVAMSTLGPRHDFAYAIALPMFWIKLGFVASLAILGTLGAFRSGLPGRRVSALLIGIVAVVGGIWIVAIAALVESTPVARGRTVDPGVRRDRVGDAPDGADASAPRRRPRRLRIGRDGRARLRVPLPRARRAIHRHVVRARHARAD